MAAVLEGGCIVTGLTEGEPARAGTLRVYAHVGRATGARAISLRVLELEPGVSPGWRNPDGDEVLYVLAGRGTAFIDGVAAPLEPDTGFHLRAGESLALHNDGPAPLRVVSSRCPEPERDGDFGAPVTIATQGAAPSSSRLVRLAELDPHQTGDRWYRVLIGAEAGSAQVTQFVGGIPPGRAPDHYHHYEEVLVILEGRGRMWVGQSSCEIAPGACIYLPRGQLHCVENLGSGELRLLGVFYPAGSPAVRYES